MRLPPAVSPLQLLALGAWSALFNVVGAQTWKHGRQTFVLLLLGAALVLLLPRLRAGARTAWLRRPSRAAGAAVAIAVVAMAGHLMLGAVAGLRARPDMTDIPLNTWEAGGALLRGENPYATRCQLWASVARDPHVTVTAGGTTIHGVPYRYGFPYFPGMLLGFLPARLLGLGVDGIRLWNLVVALAAAAGLVLLARQIAPRRAEAPLLALAAFLSVWVYPQELFRFAVVDGLIAALALFAWLALARGRWGTAGVLLGLAQGCKLLPAPLLLLTLLVWARGRPGWRLLLGGYALAAGALIVPFALWDPASFWSATILFYLVHHARGDNTSLYYYLPESLRTAQQVVGVALAALLATWPVRRGGGGVVAPLAAGFAAYVVFIAFGRMSHLNYLWSVWPLGCAALALQLAPGDGADA